MMLRNGVAAAGQLLVSDFSGNTQFTLPDTTAAPTVGNFSNVYARFGAMAIGTGTTAVASTHTGLQSEITTGGGERRTGANVKTYLIDGTGESPPKWKSRWETTWTFTASFAVSELGVFNAAAANTGVCLLRQVFASPLYVVSTDLLNLVVTVSHSGSFTAGPAGTAGGVVPNVGLKECAKLLMDPNTSRQTGNAWDSDTGVLFDAIALGLAITGMDAESTARAKVTLADEIDATSTPSASATGCGRRSGANVTGSLKRDPPDFASDLNTNFVGDTADRKSVV